MWLNAQQILLCQWAGNARQISRHLTIPFAHFPFPFFQRLATVDSRQCSRSETDAMSCHSRNEAAEAAEKPKFVVLPPQRFITHERILTLSKAIFESL